MMPLINYFISRAESLFSVCGINMCVLQWWENLKIPKSLLSLLRGWLNRVCMGWCVYVCVRERCIYYIILKDNSLFCGCILGTAKLEVSIWQGR